MATMGLRDRCGSLGRSSRQTPRSCRRILRSPAFTPLNVVNSPRRVGVEAVGAQQTSRHVVKLTATTADFRRVLLRLGADATSSCEWLETAEAPIPSSTNGNGDKPWSGLLNGLFGGLRSSPSGVQSGDIDESTDDNSPLSHAVIMFTATWCGPCSMVYRELKLAASRLQGRAPTAILVVDVESNKELATQLGVKALPTVLYLGADSCRGPIFTQGPVSASFILDTIDRTDNFGGHNVKAKWLKL